MAIRISPSDAKRLGIAQKPSGKKAKTPSDIFERMCEAHGLPVPVSEYRFHPVRKWRFDWAFIQGDNLVALEVDGGVYSGGRHTRGKGFIEDQTKLNEAVLLGWRVLRVTPADVKSGKVFELLKRAMA